jgi:hypothetical protein
MPIIVAAVVAAGCAFVPGANLQPGLSREADVRTALGPSGYEWSESDGSRGLAFPRGPLGTQTFIARLDAGGALRSLEQVLDEDHFRRVRPGMTTSEELLRLIGPPWRRMEFPRKEQVAWDYRFQDAWGYMADFSAMVDWRGIVMETVTARVGYGRDHR